MKTEREIMDKICALSEAIRNEDDAFVRANLLQQQCTLKWVLK